MEIKGNVDSIATVVVPQWMIDSGIGFCSYGNVRPLRTGLFVNADNGLGSACGRFLMRDNGLGSACGLF
jgi:hypothetical protein